MIHRLYARAVCMLFAACFLMPFNARAAIVEFLSGNESSYEDLFKEVYIKPHRSVENFNLPLSASSKKGADSELHFLKGEMDKKGISHVRYNQYFNGLPVWGSQIIFHIDNRQNTFITGRLAADLKQDLVHKKFKISKQAAQKIASTSGKVMTQKKIIYINKSTNNATYAYHLIYSAQEGSHSARIHVLVDADSGKLLKSWNATKHLDKGQGPGGIAFSNLPYRSGDYQFGSVLRQIKSLGHLDVAYKNGQCITENKWFKIVNLKNKTVQKLPFNLPVTYEDVRDYNIKPFHYACRPPSYINLDDGGFAPVNEGYSPINDATYFLKETYKMYLMQYDVLLPAGSNLPIFVFTHIGDYANAAAYSDEDMEGLGPQQVEFGNGNGLYAPFTDPGTCAHEFSHLVTDNFSLLTYADQSGGINESFSDMAHMAFKHYLKKSYPWTWDGADWSLNTDIHKLGEAMRYMDNPSQDGVSIEHAKNYIEDMSVHYSSGVFNRAFYLLSTTEGWDIEKAFKVMLNANRYYWIPETDFNFAACGVLFSTMDASFNTKDVIKAFDKVGVRCNVAMLQ